jgi:hypothetical protein
MILPCPLVSCSQLWTLHVCSSHVEDGWESGNLIEKEVQIDGSVGQRVLEKGQHMCVVHRVAFIPGYIYRLCLVFRTASSFR